MAPGGRSPRVGNRLVDLAPPLVTYPLRAETIARDDLQTLRLRR